MTKDTTDQYWKSLNEPQAAGDEFPEPLDATRVGFRRREFLRAAGFVFGGAALSGCGKAPVERAIPFLDKPEEITPGRAVYYASTCDGCTAACGLLVKCRDGRSIKLEGDPQHPLSRGGLCAVGQASILGLYDTQRLRHPLRRGQPSSWEEVDRIVMETLERVRADGGAVRFLTNTVHGPTMRTAIGDFLADFPDARHVVYDPLSSSAILDAHERTHGVRVLPHYRFDQARVIVSFDADFLGTWISPVEFTAAYQSGRNLEVARPEPSYHVQFESRLSLTGSKADERIRIAPGEVGATLTRLAALVARRAGVSFEASGSTEELEPIAQRLWGARGDSLVVCGAQDADAQAVCNFINQTLGNYGITLDIEEPSHQLQGSDRELATLIQELDQGRVSVLFIVGVNPLYDLSGSERLEELLRKVPLVVSFAERLDETAETAHFVCPDHHYLESWGDREPVAGTVSLLQPCIRPLGDTRQLIESLSAWRSAPKAAHEVVQEHWRTHIFPQQAEQVSFQSFWDKTVRDGCVKLDHAPAPARQFNAAAVQPIPSATSNEFTLVLYPKVGLRDGRHAYNPWLHELPDPITKVTWDNYACLSPLAAQQLRVSEEDVIRIKGASSVLELPVVIQPGQHDRVVAVALGYGGKITERFADLAPRWLEAKPTVAENGRVGTNSAPLLELSGGTLRYVAAVELQAAGKRHPLACTQVHHNIRVPENLAPPGGEVRPVIQETALAEHQSNVRSGKEYSEHEHADLWGEDHPFTGHRWAMAIDLNACTGCSACVVACQVENNTPVVGKDEVRRSREMHWLRIDRYYQGDGNDVRVAHQPMMCQHCEHAPCETVCPVLATVHSEEGLNQQVYNRCVGTRYCANNCPYKVRRFNWFDYPRNSTLENMVLNPDVTVRSRGVMEKCTFCVQRIQEAKIEARRQGKPVEDGAIQPACQQTCPAGAIVFGDLNDPDSRVSQLLRSSRRYQVLEEINVRPSVGYLRLVRQQSPATEGEAHG
ncbi:MAG: 4Fe-4S dicluster domain-containing protein [Bryobacteraceae bacterium]|nr:4Fe-4S dicluster domain-containing protein [Bryobacteraceae bacterium]